MNISKQKVRFFLRLSISVAILGILFKVLHWMYAGPILIAGCIGIGLFYSLRFYQKKPKEILDYSRLALVISFLFHYVIRVFHLPYGYIFRTLFQLSFVLLLILYIRDVLFVKPKSEDYNSPQEVEKAKTKALSYLLYGIATIGVVLGSLFKILHWEFGFINGNIVLTIGLLAAAVSVFMGDTNQET